MLRFGTVDRVKPGRVKVRFPAMDDVLSDWLFVATSRSRKAKDFWMPTPGESVACVLDEDLAEGIVFPHFTDEDAPPECGLTAWHRLFEDGTFLEYDPESHRLKAHVQGDVELEATGSVLAKAPAITLEGEVTVKGPLKVQGPVDIQGSGTVSGNWTTTGTNSAHHEHPVSGATAQRGA